MTEVIQNDSLNLMANFLHKHWEQLEFIFKVNHINTSLSYDESKSEFQVGIKLNIDKMETNEKWSKYVVRRVYNNKRKNFYEDTIYWLFVNVYSVDRFTTKESLYNLVLNDIILLRNEVCN
jgi:hypothetical protein